MKKIAFVITVLCLMLCVIACQKACEHSYEPNVLAEASCDAKGIIAYNCTLCGYCRLEEKPMLAHSFGEPKLGKESTCAEEGEMHITCTVCGTHEVVEKIPVIEHKYLPKVTTAPTCVEEGVRTYTCSGCGDEYTEPINKTSHKYTSKITTAATCTQTGQKTFTCSVCQDSYTETTPKANHNYTAKITSQATCTTDGVKTYTCSGCNNSYKETIKAKGHSWVNATCTKAKYCSVCNKTSGSAKGHNYNSEGVCKTCGITVSATIELPSVPEVISYSSSGKLYFSCEVTKITTSLYGAFSSGLWYEITFEGKCTYIYNGNNQSSSMRIGYKLYDSDGFVVKSGTIYTESVAVGEKFKETINVYDLTPGETYTLVITDVN